jgi:L-lysine 2,3-aminomutase
MNDSTLPLWRQILRTNFVHWEKLAAFLELDESQRSQILKESRFSLNLPVRLANKIAKRTLDDPILKQFLPVIEETHKLPTFVEDPVGDQLCRRQAKMIQKYKGRALLVCTSACAMHCRFCFRQNFDYDKEDKTFGDELRMIAEDS